jgi:prepilin-type processing-associated H-X9-DG protein
VGLARTKIAIYLCPSAPVVPAPHVIDACFFYTRPPIGWDIRYDKVANIPGYGAELGRSNYLAVGGAFGKVSPDDNYLDHYQRWGPYTGIFYDNSQTSVRDITDGMSNTLAFGEYLGGLHRDGTRKLEASWMGAGWLAAKWGLAPIYGPAGNDYDHHQFQSKHPGNVVHFAFADGSVRGISPSVGQG